MSLFERVLVPLDGSPLAELALGQVRKIVTRRDAEVLLLRAVPPVSGEEVDVFRVMDLLEAEAARYLMGAEEALRARGARVQSFVRRGPAAETILSVAERERASLLVMSTHGRTGIARWVFGSVAEKILRASPIPVLAVRSSHKGEGEPAGGGADVKKILVPIEGDLSSEILPAVVEVARLYDAKVLLLNVMPEGPAYGPPVPRITNAYEKLRDAGLSAEPLVRQGNAAAKILEVAREEGVDLVAMCTHGRSGVPRWALGSVTEKVLRGATVPLLVVRNCPTPRAGATREPAGEPARRLPPLGSNRGLKRSARGVSLNR